MNKSSIIGKTVSMLLIKKVSLQLSRKTNTVILIMYDGVVTANGICRIPIGILKTTDSKVDWREFCI